jgi:hypothetical protein
MSSEEPPDVAPFPAFEESALPPLRNNKPDGTETPKTRDFPFSNPSSGEEFDTAVTPDREDLFLPDTSQQQQQVLLPLTPDRSFSSTRAHRTSPANRYLSRQRPESPIIQNNRRHGGHHYNSNSSPSKPSIRDCVCGRGVACIGMTQAFRLLGDPRAYYVELPRYRKDPPAYKYVFRNNLRQAYLRHMVRQNPEKVKMEDFASEKESHKRRYVALHHFHPAVVRAFYENPLTSAQKHKVPISITEHELEELGMSIFEEDQILSASGMPTGGYYFVPNYSHEFAHEDLKTLIQAVRASRHKKSKATFSEESHDGSSRRKEHEEVPTDIEISEKLDPTTKITRKSEVPDVNETTAAENGEPFEDETFKHNVFASFNKFEMEEKEKATETTVEDLFNDTNDKESDFDPFPPTHLGEDGLTSTTEEFDNLWEKDTSRDIETNLFSETIFEEENEVGIDDADVGEPAAQNADSVAPTTAAMSSVSRRPGDRYRPWDTPKYRRDRTQDEPKRFSVPAHYIDPNSSGNLHSRLSVSAPVEDDGEDIARIAADMTVFRPLEQPIEEKTKTAISPSPSFDSHVSRSKASTGSTSPKPKRRFDFTEEDAFSVNSGDSGMSGAIFLNHQLPGADPTLRIQVHNDLIAWESKRRSDLAQLLAYNRERWQAAADILKDGIAEAQYAERLILGICKASKLFADSLKSVYDDKLLDDRGNAVKYSFLQNRLAKQRSKFEYSIENEDAAQSKPSMLLDSIVEAQLEIANDFVENTAHMEQEIVPEIVELTVEITRASRKLELLGESIICELKRSEIEVKNIWGKCTSFLFIMVM